MTSRNDAQRPNLRTELELLAKREAEEAEKIESGRSHLVIDLDRAEALVSELSEQLARARHSAGGIREKIETLGPPDDAVVSQYISDRVGVLGRVLATERHEVDAMTREFDSYWQRTRNLESQESKDASIGRDRNLVMELEQDQAVLDTLPEAVRAVVLEKATEARDRLRSMDVPDIPTSTAPVYIVEGATTDGGHVYLAVLPVSVSSEQQDDTHSMVLVNAIAAVCRALRHRPDIEAPIVTPLPNRDYGVVISTLDSYLSEDDGGLFAIRLEDELRGDSSPYRIRTESIDDSLLRHALVELASTTRLVEGF